jgi:hypothetical protein
MRGWLLGELSPGPASGSADVPKLDEQALVGA